MVQRHHKIKVVHAGAPPGHGIPPFTQSGIHPDTVIRFYVYVLVLYDKNPNFLLSFSHMLLNLIDTVDNLKEKLTQTSNPSLFIVYMK